MFKKGARVIGVAWCCFVSMVPSFFAVHAADRVKVNIGWEYKDIEAKVELYEVKNRSRLWETKSVKLINLAPIGDKIESSVLLLEPGQSKRFVLVMRNETEKPLFFFAAPHVAHPVEHSLGFKFRCLCINHAFIGLSSFGWQMDLSAVSFLLPIQLLESIKVGPSYSPKNRFCPILDFK